MRTIAVLGPEGTFSQRAADRVKRPGDSIIFKDTIEDVLDAVPGCATHALVPVENVMDGFVSRTLDGVSIRNLKIIGEITVPVRYALVGRIRSPEDIRTLHVQFAAKAQIPSVLKDHNRADIIVTESNTASHRSITKDGDAAIIPAHIPTPDLPFRSEEIAENVSNRTRFWLLGCCEEAPADGPIRVSVVVTPDTDRPGLLYDILSVFSKHGINLVSIMSRPNKKTLDRYNFFIEMEGASDDRQEIGNTLSSLRRLATITVLGYYGNIAS
jgi:prephenate dehydratase